ncbi:MAG TPA: Hsp70 family protein, partial [Methanosarcinales archaeon]|nr:Hsp70 family protein [Methanosarcinales archaeon]
DIDANGIIHVTAQDKGTGKEQKITITAPHKLSEDEIKSKINDAEQFEEDDKKAKELIELKNQADTLAYTTEKALSDLGDKVTEDQRKTITEKIEKTRESIGTDDKDQIQSAVDELTKEMQAISTMIYEQAAKEQQAAGGAGAEAETGDAGSKDGAGEATDENVVDAEYEVVDEEKDN